MVDINFMSQNKHNFNYIKDNSKSRSGNYYQKFELRNGNCIGDENKVDLIMNYIKENRDFKTVYDIKRSFNK